MKVNIQMVAIHIITSMWYIMTVGFQWQIQNETLKLWNYMSGTEKDTCDSVFPKHTPKVHLENNAIWYTVIFCL